MQPYQNYSMNNMPMYQQPIYQPMQNAFMDNRLAQLQNMQQSLQPMNIPVAGLNGRMVEDFNIITANDVPMDGKGAVFIKNDGSEIQIRNWTAQGTIATSRFKPVLEEMSNNLSNGAKAAQGLSDDTTETFMKRFDDIIDRFDKLEKSMVKVSAVKVRKEGVSDD